MSTRLVGHRRSPEGLPLTLTLAMITGLMVACGEPPRSDAREPGTELHTGSSTAAIIIPAPEPVQVATESGIADGATLSVEQVVIQALARNPTREVFAATRAAALAEIRMARAWANPELELSGGRAKARDGSGSETIYGVDVRQRFELPGKRSSRIDAAMAGQAVAEREVAIDALTLEAAVREACLGLAAAEATLTLAQTASAATEQMYQAIEGRAAAKEAEPGELARARLELVTTAAVRERAERQVAASRSAVRVWAGGGLPEHFTITDALAATAGIEQRAALAMAAEQNPRLGLLRAQMDARTAELVREQRAWQPDVTIGAFSDQEADTDNLGLSVGIELPLWNRNQGGVALASAQQRRILAQWRAELQFIAREVDLAWQAYESSRLALGMHLAEAKSAAEAALNAKSAAFAAGDASLLDMLDARRAAQAVDEAELAARLAAAEAWLDLGQAIGSFSLIPTVPVGGQP